MRIIAGEFRGRTLLAPESDATRPITDRAKQSLFDILTPMIPDALVFDCFAGTRNMGLECLTRGAARVVFFQRDRSALARLRSNIQALGVTERSMVIAGDIFKSVPTDATGVQLVFLDPPYRFLVEEAAKVVALVEQLSERHLSRDATVVFRHDAKDQLELPRLARYDQRQYGQMMIELLRPTKT